MPKDLGIDWKVIELEYLKGMRVTHIASTYKIKQCTLEARIRRMGWKTKRLTMESAIADKEAQKTIQTLATKASSYLERVVKQVDKGMDVLEAQQPATTKELNEHFDVLGKIDKVARPALGLSTEGNVGKSSIVNVAVLQQFAEIEPSKSIVVDTQQLTTEVDTMPIVRQIKAVHSSPLSVCSELQSEPSPMEEPSSLDQPSS
jgi:hypothetical protein